MCGGEGVRKKYKTIAYLLLIFAWPIAAHRFYLEHFKMGMAMGLTFIVSSFLAMLEYQSNVVALFLSLPMLFFLLVLLGDLFRIPDFVRLCNKETAEKQVRK